MWLKLKQSWYLKWDMHLNAQIRKCFLTFLLPTLLRTCFPQQFVAPARWWPECTSHKHFRCRQGFPLTRLPCSRGVGLHRGCADSVSSLPQLDTSWSGDCSDPFISLESPVLSPFPITIKPAIQEEHRICGVSSERVIICYSHGWCL